MTSAPGIFAGGDCVFGPRLIIDSVGDGKRIARSIDEYLTGRTAREPEIEIEILSDHRCLGLHGDPRQTVPTLSLERRTGITEVELVFDEETARREARRCLHCWVNTVFEGNEPDGSQCTLCGGCVDVCPESCLEIVPLDRIDFPRGLLDRIQSDNGIFRVELDDVAASELGSSPEPPCSKTKRAASVAVCARLDARWAQSRWKPGRCGRGPRIHMPCPDCTRRRFTNTGLGSIAIAGIGSVVFGYDFLSPNALYEPRRLSTPVIRNTIRQVR